MNRSLSWWVLYYNYLISILLLWEDSANYIAIVCLQFSIHDTVGVLGSSFCSQIAICLLSKNLTLVCGLELFCCQT